jgi:hypothetical protein
LNLLGRHFTTWATSQLFFFFFALVILQWGTAYFPRLAWTVILFMPPWYLGWQAQVTHSQFSGWVGVLLV